jgi:predicted ATPase
MLIRWSLRNFKSISERKDLELAPVTLVCGANNSGKSTIFQSMLAVAQTFRSTSRARALILNGQLTRLGSLSDLLHAVTDIGDSIQFGFTLHTQNEKSNHPEIVDLEVSLINSNKLGRGINHGDIPTIESYQMDVEWKKSQHHNKQSTLKMEYGPHYGWKEFEYALSKFYGFETDIMLSGDIGPTHTNVEGLVPATFLMEYNIACRQAAEDFERLLSIITDPEPPDLPPTISSQKLPNHVLELLYEVSRQKGVPFEGMLQNALNHDRIETWHDIVKVIRIGWTISANNKVNIQDHSDWARKMHNILRDRLLGLRREWIEKIEKESSATSYDRRNIPERLQIVVNDLQEFWTRHFSYLGPLRDDPKVVYKAPTDVERRSVGSKGEFTAAVLREWGEHEVEYPVPPTTSADYRYPEVQSASLMKAVITWLKHFGLVKDVSTRELSKVGYELMVHTKGMAKSLDLMNVGVGVSQVLPTLVMSLIAPTLVSGN